MPKKERLAKQRERLGKMEQTLMNTSNDIEQMECTLTQLERVETKPRRIVPCERVSTFFIDACQLFERLQHRVHRMLNNTWFCLSLCARYEFQSHNLSSDLNHNGEIEPEKWVKQCPCFDVADILQEPPPPNPSYL